MHPITSTDRATPAHPAVILAVGLGFLFVLAMALTLALLLGGAV